MSSLKTPSKAEGAVEAGVTANPRPSGRGGRGPTEYLAKSALLVVFVLMVAAFWVLRPDTFATASNFQAILNQSSVLAIFGVGVTVVLLSAEFDLAFPNIADNSIIVMGLLVTTVGLQSPLGIVLAIAVGLGVSTCFGALSGTALAIGKVPSFVASLAVGSLAMGLELGLQSKIGLGLKQISTLDLPEPLQKLGTYSVPGTGLRIGVFVALIVAASVWLLLRSSILGRHIHAVGGNPDAAYLAGVPVAKVRILVFTLSGFLAGIAGVIALSQQGYFYGASPPLLLQAYTVAFLGTAVLGRRRFTVGGTLISVMFLGVMSNGLGLLNQPTWITSVVNGTVLLTAVLLTTRRGR
jgi:ribose transport system permease protein